LRSPVSTSVRFAKPWEHRAVIEQAEGIIMGEWRCSDEEAFAVLA